MTTIQWIDTNEANNWVLFFKEQMCDRYFEDAFDGCQICWAVWTTGRDDQCTIAWVQTYSIVTKNFMMQRFKKAEWFGRTDPAEELEAWFGDKGQDLETPGSCSGTYVPGPETGREAGRAMAEALCEIEAERKNEVLLDYMTTD